MLPVKANQLTSSLNSNSRFWFIYILIHCIQVFLHNLAGTHWLVKTSAMPSGYWSDALCLRRLLFKPHDDDRVQVTMSMYLQHWVHWLTTLPALHISIQVYELLWQINTFSLVCAFADISALFLGLWLLTLKGWRVSPCFILSITSALQVLWLSCHE